VIPATSSAAIERNDAIRARVVIAIVSSVREGSGRGRRTRSG
jgi:hypothetical protein